LEIYLIDKKKIELNNFPSIFEIYKQSTIAAEHYFDEVIMLSIETSNSFEQIERMEFWKFLNLSKSLKKYLEIKNKQENGENPNIGAEHEKMMSKSKKMMSTNNFKLPKPKLK
jgi:hypothetical protein